MNDTSRYIVAIVLAMIILFSWQIIFPVEEPIVQNNIVENSPNLTPEETKDKNFIPTLKSRIMFIESYYNRK
jgi:hypothetical protein